MRLLKLMAHDTAGRYRAGIIHGPKQKIEDAIEQALIEAYKLGQNRTLTSLAVDKCIDHPTRKHVRKPNNGCPVCEHMYYLKTKEAHENPDN